MSRIKQEIHVTGTSGLPTLGASNVEYTVLSETYGLDFYWDAATSTYKRKIGDILQFPYTHNLYTDIATIKDALDYLLTPALSVSFIVYPTTIYNDGVNSVQFTWVTSKDVSDLTSVTISRSDGGTSYGGLTTSMTNNFGSTTKQLTFTANVTFTITVIDTDGNTATATQAITVTSAQPSINSFTIDPTTWNERPAGGNSVEYTLDWEIAVEKEYISTLELYKWSGTAWVYFAEAKQYTLDDGTGTVTITETLSDDLQYKLISTAVDGTSYNDTVTLQFVDYVDVEVDLVIDPAGTTGIEEEFTFRGTVNKAKTAMAGGASLRLYQLDDDGGNVVAYDSVDYLLGDYNETGLDYVELWDSFSGTAFSIDLTLTVPENTYFKVVVVDVDAYGNTSTDSSQGLIDYSTDVELTEFALVPTKGYVTHTTDRSFTATANLHVPIPDPENVEYMQIYFDGTIPITVDVDPLPETSSLDFDFNETVNNGAIAGTYDVTLRYKEVGEDEVVSNQLTYYVYDTLEIESVTLDLIGGSAYQARVVLNKPIDGSISSFEYTINGLLSVNISSYTALANVITFTLSDLSMYNSETITFKVDITESLGTAGSGATSSSTMTISKMIGTYSMYMGWITQEEVEAVPLVWEENMALVDLQSILDSTYVIDSEKSVPVGGTYGYESETAPKAKLLTMGVDDIGIAYTYMWVAMPTATFTSEFNRCNDGYGAQTMSNLWHVEDVSFTIGGTSVPYKLYIHKNMARLTDWTFTIA